MDFSGVKWHFRSRKHTLFRQRTLLFPSKTYFPPTQNRQSDVRRQVSTPLRRPIQPRFPLYFNLSIKGACQPKRPSDFFLPIFSHNLRHFVLYRNVTSSLAFPHFSARRLAFFRKKPYLGRKKNSLWPNLNYRIYRTANRPCCTRN